MGAAQARLSLHLSKCHIVGNHKSRLMYSLKLENIDKILVYQVCGDRQGLETEIGMDFPTSFPFRTDDPFNL